MPRLAQVLVVKSEISRLKYRECTLDNSKPDHYVAHTANTRDVDHKGGRCMVMYSNTKVGNLIEVVKSDERAFLDFNGSC